MGSDSNRHTMLASSLQKWGCSVNQSSMLPVSPGAEPQKVSIGSYLTLQRRGSCHLWGQEKTETKPKVPSTTCAMTNKYICMCFWAYTHARPERLHLNIITTTHITMKITRTLNDFHLPPDFESSEFMTICLAFRMPGIILKVLLELTLELA